MNLGAQNPINYNTMLQSLLKEFQTLYLEQK